MTSFPSLKDDLRPKSRPKKHGAERLTDDAVEANSRKIAEKWGAAAAVAAPEPEPVPPTKVVSIRGYIPDYLDQEMTMRAAQQRVTKTFLILEALAKAGYHVEEADMIQDRRKNKP